MPASSCEEFLGLDVNSTGDADPSDELVMLACVLLGVCVLIFPSFLLYYVYHRNSSEHLKKRTLTMMVFLTLGMTVFGAQECIRVIVGTNNYDCHTYFFVSFFSFNLFFSAYLIRFASLYWRISFNKKIIHEKFKQLERRGIRLVSTLTGTDLQDASEEKLSRKKVCCSPFKKFILFIVCWKPNDAVPEHLHCSYFLASKFNTILVFYAVHIVLAAAFVAFIFLSQLPPDIRCSGCKSINADNTTALLLVTYISIFLLVLYMLRRFPDSLGVKKEIYLFAAMVALRVLILPIQLVFFKNLEKDGLFDFGLLAIPQFLVLLFYSMPYQVYSVRRESTLLEKPLSLKKFLKSEEATKVFLLYLSARLSPETLLFYKAVEEWREQFEFLEPGARKQRAEEIYEVFLKSGSIFKINISGALNNTIRNDIASKVEIALFDVSVFHVYSMMENFYADFVRSSYSAALLSELDLSMVKNMGKPSSLFTSFD